MRRTAFISALVTAAVAGLVVTSAALAEGIAKPKPHQTTAQQLTSLRRQVTRLLNLVSAQDGRLASAEQQLAGVLKNGTTPTGVAGGALTGTFPSPGLADNSVKGATLVDGSVGPNDLQGKSVGASQLSMAFATTGEEVTVNPGETKEARVTCPTHSRLLSGAFEWASRDRNGATVISSGPTFIGDPNTSWSVQGRVDSGGQTNSLFAEALCIAEGLAP